MLKSIILRDFFSFKGEQEIQLTSDINILLGINGSGKTSFINAIRLLSDGIVGEGLIKLIQEQWGGFGQLINVNGDRKAPYSQITYVFDYEKLNEINPAADFRSDVYYRITINPSGTSYYLSEKIFTQHKRRKDDTFCYLNFTNGKGKITVRTPTGVCLQDYDGGDVSGQELILRQINDPIHYLPTHTLRKAIEAISVYNDFNITASSGVRVPSEYFTEKRLRKSGLNLTQILSDLKVNHTFDYQRLEDSFRKVNPNFSSIEISNLYGQNYLSLIEKNMSRAISALHISDGTLRYLLMESIFYNPSRGTLVAIDEPERGLHPDMIRSVAEMIKYATKDSQIIIATHSPHLLNQFSLDDILVFEKDEDNATVVHRYKEDDFDDDDVEYLPGQMWLLGQIGGKRW